MNRREFVVTLVLLLVGAALVLLAGTQTWISGGGSGPDPMTDHVQGNSGASAARALGLVALAAVLGVPATRGWLRRIVGALLGLVGLGTVASSLVFRATVGYVVPGDGTVPVPQTVSPTLWPYVSVLGGVLITVVGVLTAVRGQRWPGMGARYDAPAKRPSADDTWSALDRGEDPTDPGAAPSGAAEHNGQSSRQQSEHER